MIGEFSLMTYGLLSLVDDVEIWVDNDVEISTNWVDHDVDRWNSDSEQTIRQSLKIQTFFIRKPFFCLSHTFLNKILQIRLKFSWCFS